MLPPERAEVRAKREREDRSPRVPAQSPAPRPRRSVGGVGRPGRAREALRYLTRRDIDRATGRTDLDAAVRAVRKLPRAYRDKDLAEATGDTPLGRTTRDVIEAVEDPGRIARSRARGELKRSGLGVNEAAIAEGLYEAARAVAKDPGQRERIPRDALTALLGIPAAGFRTVTDPVGTLKAATEDFEERYSGDLREKVAEHGAFPYALDALAISTGAGKAAGFAARSGVAGGRAQRAVTEPRPALKVTDGISRQQRDETRKAAPNVARVYTQKRRDYKRARAEVKRERRAFRAAEDAIASGDVAPGGRRLVRSDGAEVVPRYTAKIRQRREAVARPKGQAVEMIRGLTADAQRDFRRTLKGLSRPERNALFYAHVGLTALDDPKRARAHLERRLAAIERERPGSVSRFQPDEKRKISWLLDHADEAYTPKLRAAVEGLRELVRRTERESGLPAGQRIRARYGPQAQFLDVEPGIVPVERFDRAASIKAYRRRKGRDAALPPQLARTTVEETADGVRMRPSLVRRGDELVEAPSTRPESAPAFARRVREKASEEGLEAPSFAPSERFVEPRFHTYTAGGQRVPAPPKRRTYKLQRTGEQRTDPRVIYDGIQRNIKRRVTTRLVKDIAERSAHPTIRGTVHDIKKAVQREGIDLSDAAVWFPGRWDAEVSGLAAHVERARERGTRAEADAEGGEARGLVELEDSFRASARRVDDPRDLDGLAAEMGNERALLIPRAVYDELHSSMKETVVGRALERLKTAQSRTVLGTLNINWLVMDAVSNSALVAAFGNVGPTTWIRGQAWLRKLDPDVRRKVETEIGIGSQRSQVHKPRLGATANWRWLNAYRSFREGHPLGSRVKPISGTIDAFLKLEKSVANDPQRVALLYRLARKDAMRDLERHTAGLNRALQWFDDATKLDPDRAITRLVSDPRKLEHLGRQVDELLGDWTTFTALERRTLGRVLFFYPYLRWSLRLAFYTLPLNHPIRLSLIGQLSNLTAREQMELLGADSEDAFLLAGRYFEVGENGEIMEYSLRTLSPLGNAITEATGSEQLLNLLPPLPVHALEQILKRDLFRNREWRIHGTADREELENLTITDRGRILLGELINLPPILRDIARSKLPGEQGNDTLFFDPRPTEFKDEDRQAEADARRESEEGTALESLRRSQLRLVTPRRSNVPQAIERRRDGDGGSSPRSRFEQYRDGARSGRTAREAFEQYRRNAGRAPSARDRFEDYRQRQAK